MRTGPFLRLNRDTAAIDNSGSKPTAITVPTGAIICATAVRNPDNPQMIEVQWQDCRLFMSRSMFRSAGKRSWEPENKEHSRLLPRKFSASLCSG